MTTGTNFETTFVGISEGLIKNVGSFIDEVGAVLVGLAAIGLLSLALVNTFKTYLRQFYLKFQVRRFLIKNAGADLVDDLEKFIWRHSTGSEKALYLQDMDGIASAMIRARNYALTIPSDTGSKDYLAATAGRTLQQTVATLASPAEDTPLKDIKLQIQVATDAFVTGAKIRIKAGWDLTKRNVAIGISILMVLSFGDFDHWLSALLYGLAGGMLAPFVHDFLNRIRAAKLK